VKSDRTDTDLITATLSGNTRAFTELVVRYERAVAATVCGMLGRGDDADEIGQQVFIRFYESLSKFRGESSVKTYLTRIAMNLSLNELQRRKRVNERTRPLDDAQHLASSDTEAESHDEKIIEQALERLSSDMREVVVLRLVSGYSTEETAELLAIPVGTVLSRLSIARKKLREMLTPFFGDDYGTE
jgi:RNA polymerase sigma-70 factor (ECF subfamily)